MLDAYCISMHKNVHVRIDVLSSILRLRALF